MRKLKQALSLSLALVLSLALSVPAFAAGTTETYVDEEHGVTITMNGFLRKETHTYLAEGEPETLTLYVLADGSTVEVKANAGFKYAQDEDEVYNWQERYMEDDFGQAEGFNGYGYAWSGFWGYHVDDDGSLFVVAGEAYPLEDAEIYTARGVNDYTGDGLGEILMDYSVAWISESLFAKLTSVDGQPTTPTQPAQSETATPTNDKLMVDGVVQNPTVYKIGGYNYFKIRDLAAVLNSTGKQFAVGYDAATSSVTATTGQGYTKQATDLLGAPSGTATADVSNDTILVNGQTAQVEVYKIDGMNYFKLRDLGSALGFQVGWDAANNVASIDTRG